jgi:hypothetical protein
MSLVTRHLSTSNNRFPWMGLQFAQLEGSDALHDQLKNAYPTLLDLKQRKHKAVIDFLTAELHTMQTQATRLCGSPTGHDEQLDNSSQNSNSRRSSPSTSSSGRSVQMVDRGRPETHPNEAIAPRDPPTLPTLQEQTLTFNVNDMEHFTQKPVRRRMTTKERKSYKIRRDKGACARCKKLKAKVFTFRPIS